MPIIPMPDGLIEQRQRIERIATSYHKLSGHPLVDGSHDLLSALWSAPHAIVAHGTELDPVFFFGNQTALGLFEYDFASFTRLPSRLSAEPLLREERSHLLDRVTRTGLIEDYAGVRISRTGRRFRIADASVWNLTGADGSPAGQAAAFINWQEVS